MSEIEMPLVVTAVASPNTEGFIASTLFSQGWSVIFRALDIDSLNSFANKDKSESRQALLIYSTDLPGISHQVIQSLRSQFRQVIGFSKNLAENDLYGDLHEIPTSAQDLISLVRGLIRTPLLRSATVSMRAPRRAKIIALSSAGSHTGCTTLAINIAMELSVLNKPTLLIDANFRAPSISANLAIRNLASEGSWIKIAPDFSATEVQQESAPALVDFMERASKDFDFVIVDLGSISGLSDRLTDRRWTSSMTTWICDYGDELIVTARPDLLGVHRLDQVISLMAKTSIRSETSFLLNMRSPGRKGASEEARFLTSVTPMRPSTVRTVVKDSRSAISAQEQRATLVEVNQRGALRKAVAKIASELLS